MKKHNESERMGAFLLKLLWALVIVMSVELAVIFIKKDYISLFVLMLFSLFVLMLFVMLIDLFRYEFAVRKEVELE